MIRIETACEIKKKCIATDNLLRQQIKDEDEVEIKPEFLQDGSEDKTCVAFVINFDVKQETDKLIDIRDCLDDTRINNSLESDGESSEGPSRRK